MAQKARCFVFLGYLVHPVIWRSKRPESHPIDTKGIARALLDVIVSGDHRPGLEPPHALRKTAFLSHLNIKTIIVPRQARDKHKETQKKMPFVAPSRGRPAARNRRSNYR
jgi:hypothetical protein